MNVSTSDKTDPKHCDFGSYTIPTSGAHAVENVWHSQVFGQPMGESLSVSNACKICRHLSIAKAMRVSTHRSLKDAINHPFWSQLGKQHWTRVSLLLELISSAYPMAVLEFEPQTSDMRGECVTTIPPAYESEFSLTGSLFDGSATPIISLKREDVHLFKREISDAPNVRCWSSGNILDSHVRCPEFRSRHEKVSTHVPTPNLEDRGDVFVRTLTIYQPGMRDSGSVARTPRSIAEWVAELHKPSHYKPLLVWIGVGESVLGQLESKCSSVQRGRPLNNVSGTRSYVEWEPRNPQCAWLETLQNMSANRPQYSCCRLLSTFSEWVSRYVSIPFMAAEKESTTHRQLVENTCKLMQPDGNVRSSSASRSFFGQTTYAVPRLFRMPVFLLTLKQIGFPGFTDDVSLIMIKRHLGCRRTYSLSLPQNYLFPSKVWLRILSEFLYQ
ncbi:hypothetical protein CLF_103591 [Clonorchis sinensis]|uniref:Uncharacterized protein n=1 Tax=Clonorchis sinensis TaxID=79923 RepID=G7Y9Z8_CLOSI|nr:hypothetical protein CLF_103591 [Clonorchis sinensis]